MEKRITASNQTDSTNLEHIGWTMDTTLFRREKQGWGECWQYLLQDRQAFEHVFLNITGGYRAFEITCLHCQRLCAVTWDISNDEEALQATRRKWLSSFRQETLPGSASEPSWGGAPHAGVETVEAY